MLWLQASVGRLVVHIKDAELTPVLMKHCMKAEERVTRVEVRRQVHHRQLEQHGTESRSWSELRVMRTAAAKLHKCLEVAARIAQQVRAQQAGVDM